MSGRWGSVDTIGGSQKPNNSDDERENLSQAKGRYLCTLHLKLSINKLLFDGVTVLRFSLKLL